MSINLLLSTIVLVSFLVTIVMAVGSYVAYKLREARRPRVVVTSVPGDESSYFERIRAEDL